MPTPQIPPPRPEDLLAWYDRHRRHLPWRALPGVTPDPYAVWLSEIMLQQTTVAAVKSYYETFLSRWPTVADLAAAPVGDVMSAWAGLGYYARARNLHRCAHVVTAEHATRFPTTEETLRALPGVGPYTAAAIAAIAFGAPAVVVDGNVERVMARVFAVRAPLPRSKPTLKAHAASLTPQQRPGDYAQAVMDLGATVCTPKAPKCMLCPWAPACKARAAGIAESLPRKMAKAVSPQRYGVAYWMMRKDGAIFLERRPSRGLLGGMLGVPSTAWRSEPWSERAALRAAPPSLRWSSLKGSVRHTFTHFRLELKVMVAAVTAAQAKRLARDDGSWIGADGLAKVGLPTVMRKVADHALAHALD